MTITKKMDQLLTNFKYELVGIRPIFKTTDDLISKYNKSDLVEKYWEPKRQKVGSVAESHLLKFYSNALDHFDPTKN